jgi:hypothetical protein
MDLEPTLEKTVQEYGVFLSDVLGEKGLGLANRAFCECWRLCRRSKKRYFNGSLDDSISCGCALCRLFCTMYCLARVGPGLWRMGRDEVKSWLLEFENKAPFDRILISFRDSEWKIYNGQTGTEYIQFFQIEGIHHLPIHQCKPLLILLQHIRPCETCLFSTHFLDLLVLMRAFSLPGSGWKTV